MASVEPTLAFLFPGQGSQSLGMMNDLADHHPEVRETFDAASDVLGFDLFELVRGGPEDELNRTVNTQPAMLAAGVATWRVWARLSDHRPAWMAGHSLGEYTALVAAGALSFEDAVRLVKERARLMQEAVPAGHGAMAAVLGLDDDRVVELCESESKSGSLVAPANFNAPGQVVVAGHAEAVKRFVDTAKAAGARRSVILPVSVPSHCQLMEAAADALRPLLGETTFVAPGTPVLHNVDVASHRAPEQIRSALAAQMYGSVRWTDTVRRMGEQGVATFIECGPGKVLAGLNKRILPDRVIQPILDQNSLNKAMELIH